MSDRCCREERRKTYNQSSSLPFLLLCEADPEGDHDSFGITEVLPDTLHGGGALSYRQRAGD